MGTCYVVDDCYYNIATNTNDPVLCEKIHSSCNLNWMCSNRLEDFEELKKFM